MQKSAIGLYRTSRPVRKSGKLSKSGLSGNPMFSFPDAGPLTELKSGFQYCEATNRLKSVVQHQRSSKTFKKETKLHKNHQNIPIYLKKKGAEKAPQKVNTFVYDISVNVFLLSTNKQKRSGQNVFFVSQIFFPPFWN